MINEDILHIILSFLDAREFLVSVRLVNHEWNQIAARCLYEFRSTSLATSSTSFLAPKWQQRFKDDFFVDHIANRGGICRQWLRHLRKLNLEHASNITDEGIERFFQLALGNIIRISSNNHISSTFSSNNNTNWIESNNSDSVVLVVDANNENRDPQNDSFDPHQHLQTATTIIQNAKLKSLRFYSCVSLTNACLNRFVLMRNLSEMFLVRCPWVNDDTLRLLRDMPNLRLLHLYGSPGVVGYGLEFLPTTLESLELGKDFLLRDEGLVHLRRLTRLQYLGLSECSAISGEGLAHLPNESLTSLDLGWMARLQNDNLAHLIRLSGKLRVLELKGNKWLDEYGMSHFASLTRLEELHLSYCSHYVDDEAIMHIRSLVIPSADNERSTSPSSSKMCNLRILDLSNCPVTIDGIIAALSSSCDNNSNSRSAETASVLPSSSSSSSLRKLNLYGCKMVMNARDEDQSRLAAALPHPCKIFY